MADDVMHVQGGGRPIPNAIQVEFQVIEDLIEPRFPNDKGGIGGFLIFQRPGELGIVGVPIPVAYGAMIAVIPVEIAKVLRADHNRRVAEHEAAIARAVKQNGRVG